MKMIDDYDHENYEATDYQQCRDVICRGPATVENVEADTPVGVNVWMVNPAFDYDHFDNNDCDDDDEDDDMNKHIFVFDTSELICWWIFRLTQAGWM